MGKTQYTPGPWTNKCGIVFGRSIGGVQMKESDFMVAQIRGWGHLQYHGENEADVIQEANAQLIAAAPDLLAACKYVVEHHRENDSGEGELFGLDFVTTCITAIEKAIKPE